jgi:hypothetical protein
MKVLFRIIIVVKLLLKRGADPHAYDNGAIREAMMGSDSELKNIFQRFIDPKIGISIHQPLVSSQLQVIR